MDSSIVVGDDDANSRSAPPTKGFGLKKWRRIPRKDHLSAKEFQSTDKDKDSDSDSATGRMLKRGSANILNQNHHENHALFAAALPLNDAIFNAGADSDNSEDSHSKSSTAASAPKYTPRASTTRHKNTKVKTSQRLPLNKSQFQIKKAKDGTQHLDFPSPPCQQQQQRPADFSDRLSSSVNQGESKDDGDHDPLFESIHLLQSAQLALQAEVQKFGEIGKGICSLYDGSDKPSGVADDAVVYMAHGSMCDGCNDNDYLSKSLQTLERQLNEAECSLNEKELKIAELETTLRIMDTTQDHEKSAMEQQYKRCIEMEAELQVLFRQKLEAEVLLVVMTRSSKDLSVLVEDHNILSEEVQSPRKMVDVKDKAGQTEKSDTLHTGEVISEMHRRVNKLTKCFVIQLLLLVVVITLFVSQLAPKPVVVVPT